jgi:hypothetical protein
MEEKEIIISILVDRVVNMAKVSIDDKCVMEGNFGDFHPGCHGIDQYGDFYGFDDLAIKIIGKLSKLGHKAIIAKGAYKAI